MKVWCTFLILVLIAAQAVAMPFSAANETCWSNAHWYQGNFPDLFGNYRSDGSRECGHFSLCGKTAGCPELYWILKDLVRFNPACECFAKDTYDDGLLTLNAALPYLETLGFTVTHKTINAMYQPLPNETWDGFVLRIFQDDIHSGDEFVVEDTGDRAKAHAGIIYDVKDGKIPTREIGRAHF